MSIVRRRTENDTLFFTIENLNVSYVNSIRRIILGEIPCIGFKTFPYEENDATIFKNTSRLNNEIIKQRLSCVPVNIDDTSMPIDDYVVEINKTNNTESVIYVTTEDFKIKNKSTGKYLSKEDQESIFPKNSLTNQYIDFVRLYPKVSDKNEGESLHLECMFSINKAQDNGVYNVVSACSYSNTKDPIAIESAWIEEEKKTKDLPKDERVLYKQNWLLSDALKFFKQDSFDFLVKGIGVFSNEKLLYKACDILESKINTFKSSINDQTIKINASETTLTNGYDITLINEDYTLGKVLEFELYSNYYQGKKYLSFCGFKKMHPHDTDSIIRFGFKNEVEKSAIYDILKDIADNALNKVSNLKKNFKDV